MYQSWHTQDTIQIPNREQISGYKTAEVKLEGTQDIDFYTKPYGMYLSDSNEHTRLGQVSSRPRHDQDDMGKMQAVVTAGMIPK